MVQALEPHLGSWETWVQFPCSTVSVTFGKSLWVSVSICKMELIALSYLMGYCENKGIKNYEELRHYDNGDFIGT